MKGLLIAIMLCALPVSLQAATISVGAKAGKEVVNAVEGQLILPLGTDVEKIYIGDSAILMWVTPPAWDPRTHSISFAGVTPGGFSRTQTLFTLELTESGGGEPSGSLFGYRSDGEGTKVALQYSFATKEMKADGEWPEPFKPVIFSSPGILEGRRVISFVAQDKGTGIEHYEHASYWLIPFGLSWEPVSSPYLLLRSELFKVNVIRAFDAAGNYRESPIAGPYRHPAFAVGSILMVCALFFFVRRRSLPS